MMLQFTVPGTPRGKARARVVRRNGRTWAYTPKATVEFQQAVRLIAMACKPVGWPMDMRYEITVHGIGGGADSSNIGKAVEDALEGVLYTNDRQCRTAAPTHDTLAQCRAKIRASGLPRAELRAALASVRAETRVLVEVKDALDMPDPIEAKLKAVLP